jgi:hypothetical protein
VTGSWTKTEESAFQHRRRAGAAAVVAILICWACAPSASAGPVEDVVDTVGSTVKSVEATGVVPTLPSTTPPAKPPSPAATPAPSAPAQAPLQPPSGKPPAAPPRSGADPADPPAVDGVGGAAQRVLDSVSGAGSEAATGPAAPERRDDPVTAPQHRADRGADESMVRGGRTASSPPVAVRAAEVAALRRWLARVWPAVALGGNGVGRTGVVEVIVGDLLRPALAAVTGLLLTSSPILPTGGDPPLTGQHGVAGASRSTPAPPPLPAAAEGGSVLYLIAIAGLLGLLAFTVWREFRIALHPRLR